MQLAYTLHQILRIKFQRCGFNSIIQLLLESTNTLIIPKYISLLTLCLSVS